MHAASSFRFYLYVLSNGRLGFLVKLMFLNTQKDLTRLNDKVNVTLSSFWLLALKINVAIFLDIL